MQRVAENGEYGSGSNENHSIMDDFQNKDDNAIDPIISDCRKESRGPTRLSMEQSLYNSNEDVVI